MQFETKQIENGLFLKVNHNPDYLIKEYPSFLDFNSKNVHYVQTYDYYLFSKPKFLEIIEEQGFLTNGAGNRIINSQHHKIKGKKFVRYNKNNLLILHIIEGDNIELNYTDKKSSWIKSLFGKKEEVMTEKLEKGDVIYFTSNFPFYLKGEGIILHHEIVSVTQSGQLS